MRIMRYWLPILLFTAALVPRVAFPTHISIIPDVERDYLEAARMVEGREMVWLGIPSSVPRFSQGPLNIWFAALAFLIGGLNPISPVILAGLFVSLGVVLFYELLRIRVSRPAAVTASLLWVASLSGITQSRMPFYLFAEPVFLVLYLIALLKLSNNNRSALWAALGFFALFQWELATIPLAGLLVFSLWNLRINIRRVWLGLMGGAFLGLLPQIIFDTTHQCRQLCGFGVWMGYRLAAVTGFDGRHGYSLEKLGNLIGAFGLQLKSLLGLGNWALLALLIGIGLLSLGILKRKHDLLTLSWVGIGLLVFGLFIHGEPSEAYFPPFLILVSVVFAYGMNRLKRGWQILLFILIGACALFTSWQLIGQKFYRPPLIQTEVFLR